jgi:hypothetical protein
MHRAGQWRACAGVDGATWLDCICGSIRQLSAYAGSCEPDNLGLVNAVPMGPLMCALQISEQQFAAAALLDGERVLAVLAGAQVLNEIDLVASGP